MNAFLRAVRTNLVVVWGWIVAGWAVFLGTRAARWATTVLVIVVGLKVAIWVFPVICGILLPKPISQSLVRSSANKVQAAANFIDKDSLKSEAESGIFATVTNDETFVYGDSRKPLAWPDGKPMIFAKGVPIRVLDLKGKSADGNSEGLVSVMLENPQKDFIGSPVVWIPARKIEWGKG